MSHLIALIDCNNFFVSCERVFEPKWEGIPVGVLSSNDGCFVARSNELKALGIPMGAPFHEFAPIIRENNAVTCSSNFALYRNLSKRVFSLLKKMLPTVEIYSVDEAFIEFGHDDEEAALKEARAIRERIRQWIGIPVSIGISTTKVLTKLACHHVKSQKIPGGCVILTKPADINKLLKQTPVGEIWGIGRKSSAFLESHGIGTALQFKQANENWVKRNLSISGVRIQKELHRVRCLDLEAFAEAKQSILRSRSFGTPSAELNLLKEAIATHAFQATRDLRRQRSMASAVGVFIRTNPFGKTPQYRNSTVCYLNEPTDVTSTIITQAFRALDKIYKPGYLYKKAGVFLGHLELRKGAPLDLFRGQVNDIREAKLNHTMDQIYNRWGTRGLFIAGMGTGNKWRPRSSHASPNYTGSWKELRLVKAN